MNTSVWGPPSWRVWHGLAQHAPPADMEAFAEALGPTLPCRFCRDSYRDFRLQLGPVTQDPPRYAFDLHNLVNRKLRHQEYDALGIKDDALRTALFQKSLPSLDAVTTRASLTGVAPEDVWAMLALFAYNADSADKRAAFVNMVRVLARVLRGGSAVAHLKHSLARVLEPLGAAESPAQLVTRLWWAQQGFVPQATRAYTARLETVHRAKARACGQGVCR